MFIFSRFSLNGLIQNVDKQRLPIFHNLLTKSVVHTHFWPFKSNLEYKHVKHKWHIHIEYGKVKVIDCSFYKCKSSEGSAINTYQTETIIKDSLFFLKIMLKTQELFLFVTAQMQKFLILNLLKTMLNDLVQCTLMEIV